MSPDLPDEPRKAFRQEGDEMKIAVIGTGHVGGALGTGWARAGHEVTFGARDASSKDAEQLISQSAGKAKIASVADAIARAEVVALAIPWAAVPDALGTIAPALSGKILIDCTNPTAGFPGLDHSGGSGGEQVARLAPNAKVVKAFNTTGFENMQNPKYAEGAVTMFYAGDDADAKKVVHSLAKDLGFDPVDAGGLPKTQALEMIASFWGNLAYGQKLGRGIAFRLIRRGN
jgi:8-hydroxy-5-deazaflavin:NADPH oxidoreductase